jgi:3'(2'), 5'-bisphosphate nucleotidase
VWIVDPLDGTREYGEPGRSDWAVHVALWAGGELAAAAVALPALGEVLVSDPAPAAPDATGGPVRIAVSRTRPPELADAVAAALGGELVPLGSAGYKTVAVARGEVDAYVHAGGMYQWDSAAPVAVARAAGLVTCRLDGAPLVYNDPDPSLPDLLVCRPELAGPILAAVRSGR